MPPVASPLGVCVWPEPGPNLARTVAYPGLISELLAHSGIPFVACDPAELEAVLPSLSILVTVGDAPFGPVSRNLSDWVERGGIWIAVGGTASMPDLFGVDVEQPAYGSWGGGIGMLGEGYLQPVDKRPLTAHLRIPMHFFNGLPVRARPESTVHAVALDSHQQAWPDGGRAAIVERAHGAGRCLLIAPDVTGSIVRIRQGAAVSRDGVPAPDGTAPICDGVLKSDDGSVLDWRFDRQPVPGVPGYRAFLEPVADQWAELLTRSALWAASQARVSLPLLWLYPRDLPAVGVLSHDSDGNDPGKATALLGVLEQAQVHSTWCVMAPGYPPGVIDAIRAGGHELGMHFDAMSEGLRWSPEEFARQHRGVCQITKGRPATNKNHYLRWEGDMEFYDWCEAHGVRVDQSKGASKTGEAGFNFGACHPYRPVRMDGSTVAVLEMPTPTQDLIVFAPTQLGEALTDAALRSHGVLHLLFHPAHIETDGVAAALLEAVARGKAAGMEWWTASQVADWDDARRECRWADYSIGQDGGCEVSLLSRRRMADATLLWLDPGGDTERWGFRFATTRINLEAGETARLRAPTAEEWNG